MQKFQNADWLRARQLIPNSAESWNLLGAKSWNWVQKVEIKLIDRKVAKAKKKKKMADSPGESDYILIQSLKENAKNKNTRQSTNNWLKVWKSWASQKGYDESIENYEP